MQIKANLFIRGETVTLNTEAIDKEKLRSLLNKGLDFSVDDILTRKNEKYKISQYVGSGLGAGVWEARNIATDKKVALKIYNPPGFSGTVKKFIRKLTHLLVYQAPFPYRYIKEAVLANVVVGDLLASVVENESGKKLVVRSRAIFFSQTHKSWGEIIDWAQGKNKPGGKQERKDTIGALRQFRKIAQGAGFTEHLYQVDDRLGAPAHTFKNIIKQAKGDFLWVDRTPAVPIVLILYPYHFAAVIKTLGRGRIRPLFDQLDSKILEHYLKENLKGNIKEENLLRLNLYKKLRRDYEASRINLLGRITADKNRDKRVRKTTIKYWRDSRDISAKAALYLQKYRLLFLVFAFLDVFPFLGVLSRRVFLNPKTFITIYKISWPVFGNRLRQRQWMSFRERSIKKATAWVLEDARKMYAQEKITLEELHRFEEATKTKEWFTYIWTLFWHGAGKIPGDILTAALGGYALWDVIKMAYNRQSLYLSGPVILGIIGVFLPGLYRVAVTLLISRRNPDIEFKWYWVAFSGVPSLGYLAIPFQVLTQTLSNKTIWLLFGFKLKAKILHLLDVIPGYREFDFYILNKIRDLRQD